MQVGDKNGSGYEIIEMKKYLIDGEVCDVYISRHEEHPQVGYYTVQNTLSQYWVKPNSWIEIK